MAGEPARNTNAYTPIGRLGAYDPAVPLKVISDEPYMYRINKDEVDLRRTTEVSHLYAVLRGDTDSKAAPRLEDIKAVKEAAIRIGHNVPLEEACRMMGQEPTLTELKESLRNAYGTRGDHRHVHEQGTSIGSLFERMAHHYTFGVQDPEKGASRVTYYSLDPILRQDADKIIFKDSGITLPEGAVIPQPIIKEQAKQ